MADKAEKCPSCGAKLDGENAVERVYGAPDKKGERQVERLRCPACGETWKEKA